MDEERLSQLSPNLNFDPRATQFTQDQDGSVHPFQFTQNTQNTPERGNSPSSINSPNPPVKHSGSFDDEASESSSLIIERALSTRRDTPHNKNNDSATQTVTPAASIPSAAKKQKVSASPDDLWKSYGRPAEGDSFDIKKSPEQSKASSGSEGDDDDDCVLIDDPVEIASLKMIAMSSSICTGCGNRSAFCHKRLYRRYCLKAVYSYFHNYMSNCHWASHFSGSSSSTVSGIYRYAYNDRRCGDLDGRFGFFNSNWMSLPECMEKGSFQEAMNLMNDRKLQNELKASNENGYKNYCEAKNANRA